MRTKLLGGLAAFCLAGACFTAGPAFAGNQSASGAWSDVYGFNSADENQLLLNRATLQSQAKHGGVGVDSTTNIYGGVTENSTYNGPVVNSGATNMNNVNSTSTTIKGSHDTSTTSTSQSSTGTGQTSKSGASTDGSPIDIN